MVTAEQPPRKKKRFSLDETHAAVVAAGRRLLDRRGLDTGLGLVTLQDAVTYAGVPRASAYRAFQREDLDPQVAFRADLIMSFVTEDPLERRSAELRALAESTLDLLEGDDPEALGAGLREIVRLGLAANVQSLIDDNDWRVAGPSFVMSGMSHATPQALRDAHAEVAARSRTRFLPFYEECAARCGLRLREAHTWDDVTLMIEWCAVVGSFYWRYHPELRSFPRPTGPDGEMQAWTQAAVLAEGALLTLFEPDPDAAVSADLERWLGAGPG